MMLFDASKRETLQRIVALVLAVSGSSTPGIFTTSDPEPWERLFLAQQAPSPSDLLNTPTLEYFEQLLTTRRVLNAHTGKRSGDFSALF